MSHFRAQTEAGCIFKLDQSSMATTNPLAGALGSIIGYLGGEVAEPAVFERLLWPQRFYSISSVRNFMFSIFFMATGGPLHRAAFVALDVFREKGLYGGASHGHMLGTAFYPDLKLRYKIHGYDGPDRDLEVRNGLWANVLRYCRQHPSLRTVPAHAAKPDAEAKGEKSPMIRRTTQAVLHLQLWLPKTESEYSKAQMFSEEANNTKIVTAMFASELSALLCAAFVLWLEQSIWFAVYLCIPLSLKLLSIPASVRREPDRMTQKPAKSGVSTASQGDSTVLFEISDYDHGFPIIEGPEAVVRPFFRHWAHPIRHNSRDRVRELAGISLIFLFVLYFPIGLLGMLWVPVQVQIVWLAYQLYLIIAMYIVRIRGSNGIGRTEEGIAREFANGKTVALKSGGGRVIMARLDSTPVERIRHGQAKIQEIVESHANRDKIKKGDKNDSEETLVTETGIVAEKSAT